MSPASWISNTCVMGHTGGLYMLHCIQSYIYSSTVRGLQKKGGMLTNGIRGIRTCDHMIRAHKQPHSQASRRTLHPKS